MAGLRATPGGRSRESQVLVTCITLLILGAILVLYRPNTPDRRTAQQQAATAESTVEDTGTGIAESDPFPDESASTSATVAIAPTATGKSSKPPASSAAKPSSAKPSSSAAASSVKMPSPAVNYPNANSCPAASDSVRTTSPGGSKNVVISFNDGPGPSTPEILQILARNNVHATFFVTGEQVSKNPEFARRIVSEGHLIASHSWSPKQIRGLSADAQKADITKAANAIQQHTGQWPCWLRPPSGWWDATTLSVAKDARMSVVTWNVDTLDEGGKGSFDATLSRTMEQRLQRGATLNNPMVLMHDGPFARPTTVQTLQKVLDWYRSRGYNFVRMDDKG